MAYNMYRTQESRDGNSLAKSILGVLDARANQKLNEDREFVHEFLKRVKEKYDEAENMIQIQQFLHQGSAFEGLAVDESADCDIAVLLGAPFVIENFEVERDVSNYFKLKWKSHVPIKFFSDDNGYLNAAKLKSTMFSSLTRAIQSARASIKPGLAAVAVEISKDGPHRNISFDFVPQIAIRSWGQCPDLQRMSNLPPVLRKYIDNHNKNKSPIMCLSLAIPAKWNYRNGDYLFSVSFSMLEKEYLKANTNVRDMVRLVKFVADRLGWKKAYQFKPMYAKRLAIKYHEELQNFGLWDGFQELLKLLQRELQSSKTFDGFFVDDEVTYKEVSPNTDTFIGELNSALAMNPDEIQRLL